MKMTAPGFPNRRVIINLDSICVSLVRTHRNPILEQTGIDHNTLAVDHPRNVFSPCPLYQKPWYRKAWMFQEVQTWPGLIMNDCLLFLNHKWPNKQFLQGREEVYLILGHGGIFLAIENCPFPSLSQLNQPTSSTTQPKPTPETRAAMCLVGDCQSKGK